MFLLTLLVWVYLYARRIPYIRKNKFSSEQLSTMEVNRQSPPAICNPSDNLKNLFELPILFYVLTNYLFITHQVDRVYLLGAWIFVVFRILHSLVHCTINQVFLRFSLYLIASLSLWFMVLRSGWQYIN